MNQCNAMFQCKTCLVTVSAKKYPDIYVAFYYSALPLLRRHIHYCNFVHNCNHQNDWQVLSIIILHSKFIFDIAKFFLQPLYRTCMRNLFERKASFAQSKWRQGRTEPKQREGSCSQPIYVRDAIERMYCNKLIGCLNFPICSCLQCLQNLPTMSTASCTK